MRLFHWLQSISAPRQNSRGHRQKQHQLAERLEERTLLSANVLFVSGELNIALEGADDVQVGTIGANVLVTVGTNGGLLSRADSLGVVSSTSVQTIVVDGGDQENIIDLSRVLTANFPNLVSIQVRGRNGDDTIIGSADIANQLTGGDGRDTITGGLKNDTLDGSDGGDSITAGAGDDSILGGDGSDLINAGDGNDTVQGGSGQDTISGGNGDDSVYAGNGDDSVSGDAGNDTLNGDGGADTVSGGDGNDYVLGGELNDSLLGGDGNDTIDGQAGDDTIDGEAGDDNLIGGVGNDHVLGGLGNDLADGSDGNDTLQGGIGNDTLLGGNGDDSILGDGSDFLSPDSGDDVIQGQGGNDTIIGGRGADSLDGGAGRDLVASTFTSDVTPPPLPLPPPPPPPPTVGGGTFPDAIDSGLGTDRGLFHDMSTGTGDGSLQISVDAVGRFGSASLVGGLNPEATYDPIGPVRAATTTFESYIYFRQANAGARQQLNRLATNESTIRGLVDEGNSSFDIGTLHFVLTQKVIPTTDNLNARTGSLLIQTYHITNTGANPNSFEMSRYLDGDLQFDGSLIDGGGRLVTTGGDEVLFETDSATGANSNTTFVGITARGGTTPAFSRYEINTYNGLQTRIAAGAPLSNRIFNDNNNDGFVDNRRGYDVTLGLRNTFNLAAGLSVTYTTHTIFGSGAPAAISKPNLPPVAISDTAASNGGFPVTFDVVSNDTDVDGALDYSTVQIETQPANGTAVSLGNGLVTYTPRIGFTGTDTFTYSIADNKGARSNFATVTLTDFSADAVDDSLLGGDGNDTLIGSLGNDRLNGGAGNDLINGGFGNDIVFGGAGNDTLNGDEGDDTLDGQAGNDLLNGGLGNDSLVWQGTSQGKDTAFGGTGFDAVVVNGNGSKNAFVISANLGRLKVAEGADFIVADNDVRNVVVNGGNGNDQFSFAGNLIGIPITKLSLNGGEGDDTFVGRGTLLGLVRLEMNGGAGNDTIWGTNSNDTLLGSDGNDSLIGGLGDDSLSGGEGDDTLRGQDGNDSLDGGNGDDLLFGDNGNDTLIGGTGNDTANGGGGDDLLLGNEGDDVLNGEAGNDSIEGSFGRDVISGGDGNDTLDGGLDNDTISGEAGNDKIRGADGNDSLDGGDGNDTINGGNGNDTIFGGAGDDFLNGGDGDDSINGGTGADIIVGGDGNDVLLGGADADILLGEDGQDTINGQGGADTVAGNQGVDVISDPASEINERFALSLAIRQILNAL